MYILILYDSSSKLLLIDNKKYINLIEIIDNFDINIKKNITIYLIKFYIKIFYFKKLTIYYFFLL